MKFEMKYPDAKSSDRFEFEYSYVTRTPKLGFCRWCNAATKWIDVMFDAPVCSEHCGGAMWQKYREDEDVTSQWECLDTHLQHMKEDIVWPEKAENKWKDILIVVRDQLEYFKECIESIQEHSTLYNLLIWDNDSGPETKKYLQELLMKWQDQQSLSDMADGGKIDWTIEVITSETNTGFIPPNNALAECATGDYIILINSDCKVFEGWDTAMLGFLQHHPDVKQIGYWGGHLTEEGRGFGGSNGYEIDYVPGWCFCIDRATYEEFGLFNKQLQFAYCEDADLSLRLQEAGHKIYALYTPLVHHYQNKTIKTVEREGEVDVRASFKHNHEYIELRWKDYLKTNRVMARRQGKESRDGKQMECTAG
tara:strand:+ start:958 stop:2052 length:1095 start_codon:yes stop_codon:yes gene_type:complete